MNIESFTLTKAVVNEQLVRELDRRRHHQLFLVAVLGLVVTVAAIVYAWPHYEMIQLGYRMEALREKRDELLELKNHLELQRATETDPARIESIARSELGMIYPERRQMVVIEPIEPIEPESSAAAERVPKVLP